jgi:hypothetical protein
MLSLLPTARYFDQLLARTQSWTRPGVATIPPGTITPASKLWLDFAYQPVLFVLNTLNRLEEEEEETQTENPVERSATFSTPAAHPAIERQQNLKKQAPNTIEEFEITVDNTPIAVSYNAAWSRLADTVHFEFRSTATPPRPIPCSPSGYLSYFSTRKAVAEYSTPEAYAIAYVEANRKTLPTAPDAQLAPVPQSPPLPVQTPQLALEFNQDCLNPPKITYLSEHIGYTTLEDGKLHAWIGFKTKDLYKAWCCRTRSHSARIKDVGEAKRSTHLLDLKWECEVKKPTLKKLEALAKHDFSQPPQIAYCTTNLPDKPPYIRPILSPGMRVEVTSIARSDSHLAEMNGQIGTVIFDYLEHGILDGIIVQLGDDDDSEYLTAGEFRVLEDENSQPLAA